MNGTQHWQEEAVNPAGKVRYTSGKTGLLPGVLAKNGRASHHGLPLWILNPKKRKDLTRILHSLLRIRSKSEPAIPVKEFLGSISPTANKKMMFAVINAGLCGISVAQASISASPLPGPPIRFSLTDAPSSIALVRCRRHAHRLSLGWISCR